MVIPACARSRGGQQHLQCLLLLLLLRLYLTLVDTW